MGMVVVARAGVAFVGMVVVVLAGAAFVGMIAAVLTGPTFVVMLVLASLTFVVVPRMTLLGCVVMVAVAVVVGLFGKRGEPRTDQGAHHHE